MDQRREIHVYKPSCKHPDHTEEVLLAWDRNHPSAPYFGVPSVPLFSLILLTSSMPKKPHNAAHFLPVAWRICGTFAQ